MKKSYAKPLVEVMAMDAEDIMRTSNPNNATYDGSKIQAYSDDDFDSTEAVLGLK